MMTIDDDDDDYDVIK